MCGAGGCYCVTVMSSLGSTTQPNTALVSWPLLAVVVADGKWEWLSTSVGFSAKSHTSNVELCCAAYCTSLSYCSSEKFEPIEVPRPSPPKVKREIPPYNGFGSEEDSLASCLNLIPKPPRRCVHCHRFTAVEVIHKLGSINTGISWNSWRRIVMGWRAMCYGLWPV